MSGFSITNAEFALLTDYARQRGAKTVLEFGPGESTRAFLAAGCAVRTLEHDPAYLKSAIGRFRGDPRVNVSGYGAGPPLRLPAGMEHCRFDLAFVDGPPGHCFRRLSRVTSVMAAMTMADVVLLHDADRPKERATLDWAAEIGWRVRMVSPRIAEIIKPEEAT